MSPAHDPSAGRLTVTTVAGSLLLAVALLAVHLVFRSQIALAQAADSISDMLGGGVLLWAVRTSARPADDDHPRGHHHAEPIAALVVAVLAGALSIEVLRAAVLALAGHAEPELDWPVAAVFAVKVGFKTVIAMLAGVLLRKRPHPALEALRLDARNDVLVGSVAIGGFVVAERGWPAADALLGIVLAIYVAVSAVRLASGNVKLLMHESAPVPRRKELAEIVGAIAGVRRIDELTVTWHGAALDVHAEVAVDRDLPLHAAHAIGHAVEERLAEESDVARAVVHVGPDT